MNPEYRLTGLVFRDTFPYLALLNHPFHFLTNSFSWVDSLSSIYQNKDGRTSINE
jgi:hypothetical protein